MKTILALSSSVEEVKGVPGEIKIIPLGNITSKAGPFVVDDESFDLMKNTFVSRGLDVVIDYEHQTLEDIQAPAGGWIKDIYLSDDSVMAKVEWTPKAQEYLKNKEYRYLSPVVLVRKSDKKAIELHSVALTNTPAIDGMFPIINSSKFNQQGGNEMDIKQLALLLGLSENATEAEIIDAIKQALGQIDKLKKEIKKQQDAGASETEIAANKVVCGLLGLAVENSKTEDVAAAIMALKNPAGFVPESEFKALKERLDKKDSDELVTKALKAGKISPAQKEWAEEYALKDPTGFEKFVEKSPQVVPVGELNLGDDAKAGNTDDSTLAVCKMLGVSAEDITKYTGKGAI